MTTDKDGLVRRVFVQPHKKEGQTTTPQLPRKIRKRELSAKV